jgi:hypothetical protein
MVAGVGRSERPGLVEGETSSSSSDESPASAQNLELRAAAMPCGRRRAGAGHTGATQAAVVESPDASPLSPERERKATVIFTEHPHF